MVAPEHCFRGSDLLLVNPKGDPTKGQYLVFETQQIVCSEGSILD
jgi:hypothetical protein